MDGLRCWLVRSIQVVTDLANAADRSQSKLADRQSELRVLRDTLTAKTEQEEKDEKKMLDRDTDDIGEGSARGTVKLSKLACSWDGVFADSDRPARPAFCVHLVLQRLMGVFMFFSIQIFAKCIIPVCFVMCSSFFEVLNRVTWQKMYELLS